MKVEIVWTKDKLMSLQCLLFKGESKQIKTFESETAAIEWIRIHSDNIAEINGVNFRFTTGPINHFDIMDALRRGM